MNIIPLELMDKCIGAKIWIVGKNDNEFEGVLRSFDEFYSIYGHLTPRSNSWRCNRNVHLLTSLNIEAQY